MWTIYWFAMGLVGAAGIIKYSTKPRPDKSSFPFYAIAGLLSLGLLIADLGISAVEKISPP